MGYASCAAGCAEVSVSDRRPGRLEDPSHRRGDRLRTCGEPAQIWCSALLYRERTVKDSRIEQENFDSYNVLRIDEMPKVEAIVMPTGGFWGGVGEPTIFVAAPAVLNAI
jgi:isoquinoline 1-oxidoreductase subunit beta